MVEYLEPEEYATFVRSIQRERDRVLAQFLYESGCTATEAALLKTHALRSDGTVTFDDRTASISPTLAHAILEQAGAHLFTSRQEDSITPKRIQQILKPYLARVHHGKTTPLLLRYTHIIHAYRQGNSLSTICEQTGLTAVRVAQILEDLPEERARYILAGKGRGGVQ